MIPFISFGVVLLRGQYPTRSNPYTGGENQTGKMERLGNVKVTWNGEVWVLKSQGKLRLKAPDSQ